MGILMWIVCITALLLVLAGAAYANRQACLAFAICFTVMISFFIIGCLWLTSPM
ncbi:MAG: hypothetical protein IKD69_01550 [Solobacterium sp.]|nr:hypothetical protein [Solobacterium sp.]